MTHRLAEVPTFHPFKCLACGMHQHPNTHAPYAACIKPFEDVTEVGSCLQATELPVLDEDRQLDAESTNAGEQHFEKLTAGLYMGDIARRIILRCCLLILSMLVA